MINFNEKVEFVNGLGGVVLFSDEVKGYAFCKISRAILTTVPELSSIRAKSTEDNTDNLAKSIERTAGMPVSAFCAAVISDGSSFKMILVDGERRLAAMTDDEIHVIILMGYESVKECLQLRLDLNTNVVPFTENDLLNAVGGSITIDDIRKFGNVSQSTAERIHRVGLNEDVKKAVQAQIIPMHVASNFLTVAGNNLHLTNVCTSTITKLAKKCEDSAREARENNSRFTQKKSRKSIEREKAKFHAKSINWSENLNNFKLLKGDLDDGVSLNASSYVVNTGGIHMLPDSEKASPLIDFGSDIEWEKGPVMDNFNKPWDKWTRDDFRVVLAAWDRLKEIIRDRMAECFRTSVNNTPNADDNNSDVVPPSIPPVPQTSNAEVDPLDEAE